MVDASLSRATGFSGSTLSHYHIEEKLGEGGWGIVYKGTDTRLHRSVALKFLSKSFSMGEQEQKRFIREARAASSINHPNVCVVHSIEEIEGEEFIVMEFLEGITLRKWISSRHGQARHHMVPVKDVLELALQVAQGLSAAHRKGIVHRDIKPENVMVTPDGLVKIMDFGLAKQTGESKLTRSGAAVGTVAYMSPEQVWGGDIDVRTDIYSFGVLLYEMLGGATPFKSDHAVGIMHAIVYSEPEPIEDRREGIDPELARIVTKCLAKSKDERYQSIDGVIKDLTTFDIQGKTMAAPKLAHSVVSLEHSKRVTISLPRPASLRWMVGVVALGIVVVFLARTIKSGEPTIIYPPPVSSENTVADQKQDSSRSQPGYLKANVLPRTVVKPAKGSGATGRSSAGGGTQEKGKGDLREIPIKLSLTTDRGSKDLVYHDGERTPIYVVVNRVCVVRCFYQTADGIHLVISGQRDIHISKDQLGSKVWVMDLSFMPPLGVETLRAFATTGEFGPIKTKVIRENCLLDQDLADALQETREARKSGLFAERTLQIRVEAKQ
jgi:serine/threonine protein kinase